ncbi:MAG: hypothetical protein PW734_00095 [Verrucomicrobium sp.]|nr:hypothetical protein [Verrucomicrobium sp.]
MKHDPHWRRLTTQAGRFLSPDFARRTVLLAARRALHARRMRGALCTALLLFLVVNAGWRWHAREEEKRALDAWHAYAWTRIQVGPSL